MDELKGIEFTTPQSVRDALLDSLRRAIISGELQPGQKISERQLSETFGISTTPIKEAFKILHSEGLVEIIPRKWTVVSDFANIRLTEIFTLRGALEGLAANFAAQKASNAQLDAMAKILKMSERLIKEGDYPELIRNNTRFHEAIRAASANFYLEHLIKGILSYDAIFRQVVLSSVAEQKVGLGEHLSVLEAIRGRSPEDAELRLRNHIVRAGQIALSMQAKDTKESPRIIDYLMQGKE